MAHLLVKDFPEALPPLYLSVSLVLLFLREKKIGHLTLFLGGFSDRFIFVVLFNCLFVEIVRQRNRGCSSTGNERMLTNNAIQLFMNE